MLVAMGGGAVIFAVLTLLGAKAVTIVASSIVGTAMIVASVDFFMHGLKTFAWVSSKCQIAIIMLSNRCVIYIYIFLLPVRQHATGSHSATLLGWRAALYVAAGRRTGHDRADVHHGVARGPSASDAPTTRSRRCGGRPAIAIELEAARDARGGASAQVPVLVSSADCARRHHLAGEGAYSPRTRVHRIIR